MTTRSLNTISYVIADPVEIRQWTGLANGDDGAPLEMAGYADRSVQIGGTFDTTTVVIEGSNDGSNYVTLKDNFGNALSVTSAALASINQIVKFIRPRVTAGGGTTAITVTMLLRKPIS